MDGQRAATALALAACIVVAGASAFLLLQDSEVGVSNDSESMVDPLLQDEGHDHRNASQHILYTENIQPVSFNPLTAPGNAEVQVSDSPDGRRYAYIAGWSEMHIVDVTDPTNTTVTGVYVDPNTQVLDVKYLVYNNREYVIVQNQLVDPGAADPNVGPFSGPSNIASVTMHDSSTLLPFSSKSQEPLSQFVEKSSEPLNRPSPSASNWIL